MCIASLWFIADDAARLTAVLESAQKYIRSASHLSKLAKDAFRHALIRQQESVAAAAAAAAAAVATGPFGDEATSTGEALAAAKKSRPPLLDAALQLGLQVFLAYKRVVFQERDFKYLLISFAGDSINSDIVQLEKARNRSLAGGLCSRVRV